MYGICNLSIVPCRKEPSDKSEMVTQLLFGEVFQLLDSKGNWQLINHAYDSYECWIDKKQFLPLSNKKEIKNSTTAITTDLLQLARHSTGATIPVIRGSSLPDFKDNSFSLGAENFSFEGNVIFPFEKKSNVPSPEKICEDARRYLNTPYLWGGRSPFGIDCSGLTQMIFKLNSIKLKRDASQQAKQGTVLNFLEEAHEGDLAFFDNEEGKIVHVGIIILVEKNEIQIIHASGKVRIDKLDHHGIYNKEMKKYTHRLRVVKRIC